MAGIPDFASRDPLAPAFWDERFEKQFTPWDRGGVSADLRRFMAASRKPLTVLLPGGGSAYELVLMCEAGWDATAIDFSPVAVARARALAGPWAEPHRRGRFLQLPAAAPARHGDRAGLPVRAPARAPARAWRALGSNCWRPAACWPATFISTTRPRARPSASRATQLDALLAPGFDCVVDQAVADSIPVFAGKERWMVWRAAADGSRNRLVSPICLHV